MPETNGHQDNESRLGRIEKAIEHTINEHEKLIDEHRPLLTAQVLMVESIEKLGQRVIVVDERLGARIDQMDERLENRIGQIGNNLGAFIAEVRNDHREFHQRLKRIEDRELNG